MQETILQAAARCQVTMLELDVMREITNRPPHNVKFTPARIAQTLETRPARVDDILKDLTERRVLELYLWRGVRAYRVNPRTLEWQPPKPTHGPAPVLTRILRRMVKSVQT